MQRSHDQFRQAVVTSFCGRAFDTRPMPRVGGRARIFAAGTTLYLAIATIFHAF